MPLSKTLIIVFILFLLIAIIYFLKTPNVTYFSNISNIITKSSSILNDPNDLVYQFISLPLDNTFGSNSIPLAVSALLTDGDILELGMGLYSTPMLHRIAAATNRVLYSVDTDYDWLKKFIIYNNTRSHKIFHVGGSSLFKYGSEKNWGVVLVDHANGNTRFPNVIRFHKTAQIVVVHDAEKKGESFYQYEAKNIRGYFLYSCKFSLYCNPERSNYVSTLILSNFISLKNIESIFSKIGTDYGYVACDHNY